MRSSNIMILLAGLLFILLTDATFGHMMKRMWKKKWLLSVYLLHSVFFMISLVLYHLYITKLKSPESYFWIGKLFGLLFLFYIPKLFYILLWTVGRLFKKVYPSFHRIMTVSAGCIAGALFFILLFSITGGRYNYRIEQIEVPITHLPETFEGFTIVHLTDIHLGSYGKSYKGIDRLVEKVNGLKPDLIVFTGDMVNNFAEEMEPWIPVLQRLQAPYGKYAVTGNHDYGDYTHWSSPQAKKENMEQFYRNMDAMGFRMLHNSNIPVIRQNDTLWLAGVENWGKPPFPQYGNLKAALEGISAGNPVILLSHDPSHWRHEVLGVPVALTLSGHTHAMQMGIKIGNMEWSPSQYLYPEYDGLYQEDNRYLHVSRGQGYLGYPGRIGLRPVITQLILKK